MSHLIVANYIKRRPHRALLVLYTAFAGQKVRLFLDFRFVLRHVKPGKIHPLLASLGKTLEHADDVGG